jgi:hypothetical protein
MPLYVVRLGCDNDTVLEVGGSERRTRYCAMEIQGTIRNNVIIYLTAACLVSGVDGVYITDLWLQHEVTVAKNIASQNILFLRVHKISNKLRNRR